MSLKTQDSIYIHRALVTDPFHTTGRVHVVKISRVNMTHAVLFPSLDLFRTVSIRQECEDGSRGGGDRAARRPQEEIPHQVVDHAQCHQPSVERGAFCFWEGAENMVKINDKKKKILPHDFNLLMSRTDPASRIGLSTARGPRGEREVSGPQDHPSWCPSIRSSMLHDNLHNLKFTPGLSHWSCSLIPGLVYCMLCRFPSHLPSQREQHASHSARALCVHRGEGLHPRCLCRYLAFWLSVFRGGRKALL